MTKKIIGIIGGGPGGSTSALQLVAQGVDPADIVIYDKAAFPRPKLCGGAINFRGTEFLSELLGERPEGGASTHGLELSAGHLGKITVLEPGQQWLYDRSYLDNLLLDRCKQIGIDVREQTAVASLEPVVDGWRIKLHNGHQDVTWIIGADGAAGVTTRSVNLPSPHTGRLVEGVFEAVDTNLDPEILHFNFEPVLDDLPGYAWIFAYPKADGEMAWKIGMMDGHGTIPGSMLRDWTLKYAERNGFRLAENKLSGWPERYYKRQRKAHIPGLILVGETWGIDPFLGEGITPAMKMATYGARQIKRALDKNRSSIRFFESRFLFTEEGWNLYFHDFLATQLYGKWGKNWLRLLLEAPGMKKLADSGHVAYGRMAREAVPLIATVGRELIRHKGLPRYNRPSSLPVS